MPHLEKPDETAKAISEFLGSTRASVAVAADSEGQPTYIVGGGFVAALAVSEALNILSQTSN